MANARNAAKYSGGKRHRQNEAGLSQCADHASGEIGRAQLAHEWQCVIRFDAEYLFRGESRLEKLAQSRKEQPDASSCSRFTSFAALSSRRATKFRVA